MIVHHTSSRLDLPAIVQQENFHFTPDNTTTELSDKLNWNQAKDLFSRTSGLNTTPSCIQTKYKSLKSQIKDVKSLKNGSFVGFR